MHAQGCKVQHHSVDSRSFVFYTLEGKVNFINEKDTNANYAYAILICMKHIIIYVLSKSSSSH